MYGRYKYILLNHENSYYWARCNGFSYWYGTRELLGHAYIPFQHEKEVDIPTALVTHTTSLRDGLTKDTTFVMPYEVLEETRTTATKSYRGGIEKGLYSCHQQSVHNPGGLIKVTPKVKTGNTTKDGEPFYVGDGFVLDKRGELLIGVFLRVVPNQHTHTLEAKKCVVKVSEQVFLDPNHPIHKIILKEILPDILGSYYELEVSRYNWTLWDSHPIESSSSYYRKQLDVIMVVDKKDNPCERPVAPTPDISEEELCRTVAAFIEKDVEGVE